MHARVIFRWESNWRHGQDSLVESIHFPWFFHFQHQDPALHAWLSQAPQCVTRALQPHWLPHWRSRVCVRSRARSHESKVEYRGPMVPHLFHARTMVIFIIKPVSPETQATNRHFQNYQKWSRFNGQLLKQKTFYILINGSFNKNGLSLRSNVSGGFGHKWRRHLMTRWRWRRK